MEKPIKVRRWEGCQKLTFRHDWTAENKAAVITCTCIRPVLIAPHVGILTIRGEKKSFI